MKERPIIFSAPMVRAILDGRKTQTRRIVKPQPLAVAAPFHPEPRGGNRWVWMARDDAPGYSYATADFRCPYGVPGDRLWVKEGCAIEELDGYRNAYYRAEFADGDTPPRGKWRPSIHMPRWASRITLEIVSVRVERVQEISEEDAIAEGIYQEPEDSDSMFAGLWTKGPRSEEGNYHSSPRDAYFDLWDSINAKRAPWESNQWVWVIEFRRAGE